MAYQYEDNAEWLASKEGIRCVGEAISNARRVMDVSGCAYITAFWPTSAGDTWHMMAAVDRAVEMGVITEVKQAVRPSGQDRIFSMPRAV